MPSRSTAEPPTVLHYVQSWLPPSARFIHDLIRLSRHPAVVVSREPDDRPRDHLVPRRIRLAPWLGMVPSGMRHTAARAAVHAVTLATRSRLVHVHFGYHVHDVLGVARRRRIPLVLSLHGDDATAQVRRAPGFYDGVWDGVAAVVVPSRYFAGHAVAVGAPEHLVRVVPIGVDVQWFVPTPVPAEPEVLFVGRFVEKKGLDVLLRAWPSVRAAVPGARLRVLGYGPLERLAREAGESVEVVLAPDRLAVRDAMRRARVVTTPSRTASTGDVESLLIVNLEAQASGRALVTTDHGPIGEFVQDGVTALVVPEGDDNALAGAIVQVLEDDALAHRLALAGPPWAARFDVAIAAERHDDLYDGLLSS